MSPYEVLRYRAGLSLEQLGAELGVSARTLGRLEDQTTQKAKPGTVRRIAEFYGVSVDVLLGLEPLPPAPAPSAETSS